MGGTYSWDSDNTLPCSSTETCSATHSPITERLLEIQGESREAGDLPGAVGGGRVDTYPRGLAPLLGLVSSPVK